MRVLAPLVAGLIGLLCGSGCSLAPKSFAQMIHPAGIVRARAAGLADNQPDSVAIPTLIERLGDADPVVRLTANETLRKRTGQDFNYLPWGDNPERAAAQERWKAWWSQQPKNGPEVEPVLDASGPNTAVRGQSNRVSPRRKGGLGRWRRLR